jgi:hypothetical protein
MKKFILQFFVFCFPLALLAPFMDMFISQQLKKSNAYAHKELPVWNDIVTGKVNADIVIYGSSRAWVHFDPAMMREQLHLSAYNLGVDGHYFSLQYLRHQLLLKSNHPPKIIIHSVDAFTLQKRKDLYNAEQFLPYLLDDEEMQKTIIHFEGFDALAYAVPLVRYYGNKEALRCAFEMWLAPQQNKVERVNGYQGQDRVWNNEFDDAKKQMEKYEVQIDSLTVAHFETYIKDCKSRNIKIVFVYSPEYIEGQKFITNRQVVIDLYAKWSKEYEMPFYDFSKDSICLDKKYFYNAMHLNKMGSSIFTQKLIDEMKCMDERFLLGGLAGE